DASLLLRFLEHVAPHDREGARCIVHGDLYARHILVDDKRRLNGIIDWGDVHFGNPAVDLAVAFYVLAPNDIEPFYDAYGSVDARTRALALYRALYHAVLVVDLGVLWHRPSVCECGLRAIHTALTYLRNV
ncbi:MAG: phosphotransferase, partial [Candidatus Eremiobacteraeota bacterium]|nr:phosphotransferase [Candidatus Eremiobacteraeota bacterium]